MDIDKIAELRKDLALYPNLDIVGLLRGVVTILLDAAEGYENSEKENSLLAEKIDANVFAAAMEYANTESVKETRAQVERMEAENAALVYNARYYCKEWCEKGGENAAECLACPIMQGNTTTAGADLLACHNAEIAIYRRTLDEIRDLCEEESPAMATLGELAEIADQALNDRWGADELLYRVQKLEAVAAAAKKWASIRQGYGHGHRIDEYADTFEHEKVMSYLRLAGDDIEAALAALDTDGGGK
jgi:hypothetical protein